MAPHSDHGYGESAPVEISDDVPVLIVGGGPTGLLLAHMLCQLKVKSLIVERYPTRLAAPKAHALSPRTLEICRQFDLDVNIIRNLGTKRDDAYWVNFAASLANRHIASIPYERMDMEVLAETPTPAFEELVAQRIQKDGIVEIRKNHSFVGCRQLNNQVITSIEDRVSGEIYEVRSRQMVGCDGANSKVRQYLGIDCEGESSYETMMTIHFNAKLRPVLGENLGMLHWIMDPEVSGFIIGYDLDNTQVLICNFDPEKQPLKTWNESVCQKTVRAAIGINIPFDVLSFRPWVLSRKVAERYRDGNVFLAGDAAHSFPPTGGLGLNSGLGDVGNLAYKIAAVNQGWGSSHLLDTYESERRQVALVNAKQSVKNGQQIFRLLKTLGTSDPDIAIAKANLSKRIMDPVTRLDVLKGIEGQREHFDNLGLHIGYIYGDMDDSASASLYKPSYRAGARLPHAWLSSWPESVRRLPPIDSSYVSELSADEVAAKRYSTLDLCSFDSFTLIASSKDTKRWSQAVTTIKGGLSMENCSLKLRLVLSGRDFDLVPGARAKEWLKGLQLESGAAVMVRPDQHILNTYTRNTTDEQIKEELVKHLGL